MTKVEWTMAGAGGVALLLALRIFLRCRVRYQITRTELRIQLFGIPLRRIPFNDIERISKPRRRHRRFQYENWTNALHAVHRELVIHRRSGLWRRLLLTPANRYEFRKRLETAVAAVTNTELKPETGDEKDLEDGLDRDSGL